MIEKYPLIDVPWSESRATALESAFGPPASVQHVPFPFAVSRGTPPIHVWVWPNKFGLGKSLLVTEGLSDVALQNADGSEAEFRVELLTVSEDEKWAGNAIRYAAEVMILSYNRRFISIGQTMATANPPVPIFEDSDFSRFVFLVPPISIVDECEKLMAFKIHDKGLFLMWCNAVSESELETLKRVGDEEFGERLQAEALSFTARRYPVI